MQKIFLLLILSLTLIISGCSSNLKTASVGKVPSGKDCAENVAYLQDGVDRYKQALGEYPSTVEKLLEPKGDKGPFVKIVPKCPTGNKYSIKNGKVIES